MSESHVGVLVLTPKRGEDSGIGVGLAVVVMLEVVVGVGVRAGPVGAGVVTVVGSRSLSTTCGSGSR